MPASCGTETLEGTADVTPDNPTLEEALRDFEDGLENPELNAVWDWRLPNDAPSFSIDEYQAFLESSSTEYGELIRTALEQMGKRGVAH
jgi:hypothetical protein